MSSPPSQSPAPPSSPWHTQSILDIAQRGLLDHNAALQQEQSTTGLDALDELHLHPLLAAALQAGGLGVLREQPLPGNDGQLPDAKQVPKHSQRERCDLVLLPSPRHVLIDWVREHKERSRWQESLFQSLPVPPALPDASLRVGAWDAFWLEVKVVAQHAFIDGVPRPNASWGSQLVASLTQDLAKLAAQHHRQAVGEVRQPSLPLASQHIKSKPGLPNAALLLVVFAESPEVIAHDLPIALHRALDKGVAFRSPLHASTRDATSPPGFPIPDRIGNAWCQCVLIPSC